MPKIEHDGEVFLLHLEPDDENRMNPEWLSSVEEAFDEVEAANGPKALVVAGSGKFWSNGLDLEWLFANGDQITPYLDRINALLARTLISPFPTVAAVNGHAFGAGAMWALAFDTRIMRADRGYFCLPEIDSDLAFGAGMVSLIKARMTAATAHESMTTGRRYGGAHALAAGIVEATARADELLACAVEIARPMVAKSKPVLGQIKQSLYEQTVAALRAPTA